MLQDVGKVWGVGEVKFSHLKSLDSVDATDWTQDTKDTNYFLKSF